MKRAIRLNHQVYGLAHICTQLPGILGLFQDNLKLCSSLAGSLAEPKGGTAYFVGDD